MWEDRFARYQRATRAVSETRPSPNVPRWSPVKSRTQPEIRVPVFEREARVKFLEYSSMHSSIDFRVIFLRCV